MVDDLVCALDHARVKTALCLGFVIIVSASVQAADVSLFDSHDWGTQVCYEAARRRPDIFQAVIGTCIPVSCKIMSRLAN